MFGAPATVLEQLDSESKKDVCEVLPENWEALNMFLRLTTQWNCSGMSGATGLNYSSVDFLFRIYRVRSRKQMLEDIHVMEVAALTQMSKDRQK